RPNRDAVNSAQRLPFHMYRFTRYTFASREGRIEISPAIYRWVYHAIPSKESRQGRLKTDLRATETGYIFGFQRVVPRVINGLPTKAAPSKSTPEGCNMNSRGWREAIPPVIDP